jgi:Uma2 family endonuclease
MPTCLHHRLLTVDEFRRMGEVGILTEDDRVELIHGELIQMSPMGSRHAAICNHLMRLLARRLDDTRFLVGEQTPVVLGPHHEPEPDIHVARFAPHRYVTNLPQANDLLLVIEVADSSADYDRSVKLPLYATAGIPETWIIDVERKRVELHRRPGSDGYGEMQVLRSTDRVLVPSTDTSISGSDITDMLV